MTFALVKTIYAGEVIYKSNAKGEAEKLEAAALLLEDMALSLRFNAKSGTARYLEEQEVKAATLELGAKRIRKMIFVEPEAKDK